MYEPLKDLMLKIQDVLNFVQVGRTVAQLSHFFTFFWEIKNPLDDTCLIATNLQGNTCLPYCTTRSTV